MSNTLIFDIGGVYEQLLMHNCTRDIVVVLMEWEGTDVWGGCNQCRAFWG